MDLIAFFKSHAPLLFNGHIPIQNLVLGHKVKIPVSTRSNQEKKQPYHIAHLYYLTTLKESENWLLLSVLTDSGAAYILFNVQNGDGYVLPRVCLPPATAPFTPTEGHVGVWSIQQILDDGDRSLSWSDLRTDLTTLCERVSTHTREAFKLQHSQYTTPSDLATLHLIIVELELVRRALA